MGHPDRNECWESDRGIQVNVRDIKEGSVVVELVGTTLGAFALPLELFARIFRHLVQRQLRQRSSRSSRPSWPSWPPRLAGAH
jgi:hypothetical protein